jgi:hypothetical protein
MDENNLSINTYEAIKNLAVVESRLTSFEKFDAYKSKNNQEIL